MSDVSREQRCIQSIIEAQRANILDRSCRIGFITWYGECERLMGSWDAPRHWETGISRTELDDHRARRKASQP